MNSWVLWALLAAGFAGVTAILAKAGVEGTDSNLATAVRTSVACVFAWLIVWGAGVVSSVGASWSLSRKGWVLLVLSGVATGLSWVCYFRALQLGPVSKVAPVDKLSVVFVLVFAALFLGEPLDWKTVCGGGLIVAGAVLLAMR